MPVLKQYAGIVVSSTNYFVSTQCLSSLGMAQAIVFAVTIGALFTSIFVAFLISKQWLIVTKGQLVAHQKAIDETLELCSDALDLRDNETAGHTKRVTRMTLRMAELMGIKGVELENIRRGALLHDMGKIGIKDAILLKPGKFEPEEWDIMKSHVIIGFNMLSKIHYLWPALTIVTQHHEQWDGSGYPYGIQGKSICIGARLFMFADAFDAMLSVRPYKPALTLETVMIRLCESSGTHFDPEVVRLFMTHQADILLHTGHMPFPEESIPTKCQIFLEHV